MGQSVDSWWASARVCNMPCSNMLDAAGGLIVSTEVNNPG